MSFSLKKRSKTFVRCLSLALALLVLLPCVLCTSGAAAAAEPDDGVYRIKNKKSGQYLTAYLNASRGECKSYMAPLDANNEAQIFLLQKNEDESYVIRPQNDTALYCFAYSESTSAGEPLIKLLTEDRRAYFDIFATRSGACTIAPVEGNNDRAVLGVTEEISYYGDKLVLFTDYSEGNASQQWIFEPVKTDKLTFAFKNTDVKLYSAGKFYVRMIPYNYMQERVKWTSSDEDVIMVGSEGKYSALSCGTATVTASVDGVSNSFTVTVTDKAAFTWYSQRNTTASDWDASLFSELYFWGSGVKKRYAVDYRSISGRNSWMTEGCAICSVAMVLHNLGATLEKGYDLRSGQTGNLPADPYTTTLANTYNFGATSVSELLYGDPILANWNSIASRFFVDGKAVACRKVYNPTLRTIAKLLEEHPAGIVAEMRKGSGSHYVVFAECLNPNAATLDELQFIVYDPLGYTADQGDGVLYERTASNLVGGFSKWSLYSALIYDLAENIG